ncbi:hypothetical protein PENTCL1PPCAC_15539, partial [Pristionchus entomophagus]
LQLKDFIVTALLCYMISVAFTGSMTPWLLFLPLTMILHCYFSVFTNQPCGVPSIHDYKKRIEDAMGEPLKP